VVQGSSREGPPSKSRKGRWTDAEKALLRDWYGLRDIEVIARELRRSKQSVRRMAEELFRSSKRSGPWTSEEVQRLKKYLGATTTEVIARILGRPEADVAQQVMELGRIRTDRKWDRADVAELKKIYGTRTDQDLAAIFGRSVESIQEQAERLHLAKDKAFLKKLEGRGASRMPRWSEDEIALLRELYPKHPNLDIAARLGRSVKSVVSKAHHMGLKKDIARLREMGRENVSLRYNDDGERDDD